MSNLKNFYNSVTSFYIFNKYSFFNAFSFKFSYVYLNRNLWSNFFNSYNFFIDAYAAKFNTSFYTDLNRHMYSQMIPALTLLQDTTTFVDSKKSFDISFNYRFFSFLIDTFVTNKVFFNLLATFIRFDNISFFVKKSN